MRKMKPIITYVIITVLALWILLGAITLPNSTRWFKEEGYAIKEDIVYFKVDNNSDISIFEASEIKYGQKVYNINVFAIDNAPSVPDEGLYGVIYDLGESCGIYEPNMVPKTPFLSTYQNISKIALIKQSTNCYLVDKINNAELDGAVGVIVYQDEISDNSSSTDVLGVMPNTVNIPAYYVDNASGVTLLDDLQNFYKRHNETEPGYSELIIRIELVPNVKPVIDHWQFALIIIGIMVIISIAAICTLQIHMWKLAKSHQRERFRQDEHNIILNADEQRQLEMDENFWGGLLGQTPQPFHHPHSTRQKLTQGLVDLLPTRIYKVDDEKMTKESVTNYAPTSCVICLDSFEEGDVLRGLPCFHEYHRDCIDIWLTKKNNSCPLCLSAVQIPTVPEEIHTYNDNNRHDLETTWQNLLREEQVRMRVHPFAYNTTPAQLHVENMDEQ